MKIAILISGRAARYDACLLPLLENNTHIDIDLFMGINDENENCQYYETMKEKLKPWLKICIIKKYIIHEEILDIFNPNESLMHSQKIQVNLQKINGKLLPNNCMSMYYNDQLTFESACKYADDNNFEYDYYMKYRSDIINLTLPNNIENNENIHLHCAIPLCNFISGGLFKKPIVSDAFSWGNRKTMSIYCNTYNYVIKKNKEYDGKYYIAFECSLTDNIYENNVSISYFNIPYHLDKNRRMFDNVYDDVRGPPNYQQFFLKITDPDSTKKIHAEEQ